MTTISIIKFELINVTKNFNRTKEYMPIDYTKNLVMPIIDVERLDTTLDTSSVDLILSRGEPFEPFTRAKITLKSDVGGLEKVIYRLVYTDTPKLLVFGANKKWTHTLQLIEPTKWLERFDIDNTTITNFLSYLYAESGLPLITSITPAITEQKFDTFGCVAKFGDVYLLEKLVSHYLYGSTVDTSCWRYDININALAYGLIRPYVTTETMELLTFNVTKPLGDVIDLQVFPNLTFDQEGEYKFYMSYYKYYVFPFPYLAKFNAYFTAEWTINTYTTGQQVEETPTRYTIKQVCDLVLSKIGNECTILRDGVDTPLFHLDPTIASKLNLVSPEFTFTQNTLFGVLSKIGEEINAIPRLKPSVVKITEKNEEGQITNIIYDDWTNWNTVTFDFLGGNNNGTKSDLINSEAEWNGDNYATNFVSNIQNSFQTNNAQYASLTEPFTGGYISTRTEDANFEISNNSAVLKTTRPIQRLTKLLVYYKTATLEKVLDITAYCKEITNYNLLKDYAFSQEEISNLETKQTAIYYTRGSNIIGGLDYMPPTALDVGVLFKTQSINNIIRLVSQDPNFVDLELKDIMVQITYVPFYNFKAKQYKAYIGTQSGNNELYFNQNQTQSVDIESLGENIKYALLKTANIEPTYTMYYTNFFGVPKTGDIFEDENGRPCYIYQINKEITNNRVMATITLSKDFNKLNDYVAIRKNYREWEISERESVETNPCYNEFCVISNSAEFTEDIESSDVISEEAKALYRQELEKNKGFSTESAMSQVLNRLNNSTTKPLKAISWVVGIAESEEYGAYGQIKQVSHAFMLPCASFSFGNSVTLNFGTQDNYAVGTYSRNYNVKYALENYVKFTNKYGKVGKLKLLFGCDSPTTSTEVETTSKSLYTFDLNTLNAQNVLLDYYTNPFIVDKDSRQQFNLTVQLHFVTDTANIWLGKALAQSMPFVGNTQQNIFKFVLFKQKPDRYLTQHVKLDEDVFVVTTVEGSTIYPKCTMNNDYKYIKMAEERVYTTQTTQTSFAGYGLIDNQGRVVLFCNDEVTTQDYTKPIYFFFRRKI